MRPRDKLRSLNAWVDEQGMNLALRLTLLDLLLVPVGSWNVRPFVLLLAAAGLLHGGVLRSRVTWLLLTLLTAWRVVDDWPMSDNHAYLLSYWCLAVFLCFLTPRPALSLSRSARSMIGLAFAFAVIWKSFLSPDYLDGTFFRVLLISDPRFEGVSLSVGGMSAEGLESSRRFLEEMLHATERDVPDLAETDALRRVASLATWGTLGLEGLVAMVFLVPGLPGIARHAALLAFCATTYAVAPVPGFGWLLLAMGTAHCPAESRGLRLLYVACFALLVLYEEIPWIRWLT